jgi:hypothetical protein
MIDSLSPAEEGPSLNRDELLGDRTDHAEDEV